MVISNESKIVKMSDCRVVAKFSRTRQFQVTLSLRFKDFDKVGLGHGWFCRRSWHWTGV
jgi:hypothetical protein